MKHSLTSLLILALAVTLVLTSFGKDSQPSPKTQSIQKTPRAGRAESQESRVAKYMRAKLQSSQRVLEGLVTEDYNLIEDGAKQMQVMSKATFWQARKGPVYTQYTTEFQHTAAQLIKDAKAKNVNAATLSYMKLTINCVSCHRFIRGTKIATNLPDDSHQPTHLGGSAIRTTRIDELPSGNRTPLQTPDLVISAAN